MAKNFKDLSEQEILALAISSEETDARIYADFAAGLKTDYPATAQIFKEMEAEEDEHRRKLIEDYRRRFGEHNGYAVSPRSVSSDRRWSARVSRRDLDRKLLMVSLTV